MQPVRFADLTERERECLRLVYQHKQSKDIARLFGLSKRTVDGYLDSARAKLGVANRIEAATLFHVHETGYGEDEAAPYRITCDPIRVSESVDFATFASSPEPEREPGEAFRGVHVGEERAAFDHFSLTPPATFDWPFRTARRPHNDLTIWQRGMWSLIILFGLLVGTGLLINSFATLSQLARSLAR